MLFDVTDEQFYKALDKFKKALDECKDNYSQRVLLEPSYDILRCQATTKDRKDAIDSMEGYEDDWSL